MPFKRLIKNFVSQADQLLEKLRASCPETRAQKAEKEKYRKVHALRDHIDTNKAAEKIWE